MTTMTAVKPVNFHARSMNQRITIDNAVKKQTDVLGRVIIPASNGRHVQFEARPVPGSTNNELYGFFRADEESAKKIGIPLGELIDFLRNHENFNTGGPGAFWEEGSNPADPQPTLAEQMQSIAVASASNDRTLLQTVKQLEEDTHGRTDVLAAVATAEYALDLREREAVDHFTEREQELARREAELAAREAELLDTADSSEGEQAGQAPEGDGEKE